MSLILARSPYFIERTPYDAGATLTLTIGRGRYSGGPIIDVIKTYTLNFREQTELDISPLIRDAIGYNATYDVDYVVYVKALITGDEGGIPSGSTTKYFYVTDGYAFYEDGYNYAADSQNNTLYKNSFYAGSNTTIYRLDDKTIRLPFLCTYLAPAPTVATLTLNYYKNNELVSSEDTIFQTGSSSGNAYQLITDGAVDLETRVIADDGVFENTKCFQKFIRNTQLVDYDKIVATTDFLGFTLPSVELTIKTISECKYKPYEIIFKNRYGVEESLWFFKKSEHSLTTERESYRGNTFAQFKAGDLSYHTYQDYNVNGREMMVLNSGFLEESFSENFKQLALSEKVYIMMDNLKLPVVLRSKDVTYKQSVNEKLIDYRIEVEFAYDKLNNIV